MNRVTEITPVTDKSLARLQFGTMFRLGAGTTIFMRVDTGAVDLSTGTLHPLSSLYQTAHSLLTNVNIVSESHFNAPSK